MSGVLLLLAYLGAWNVFRLHPGLPTDRDVAARARAVAGGAALTVVAVALVASAADGIAGWLDVTGDTIRVAVGAVVVAVALRDLFTARTEVGPAPAGWRAALMPVFFPLLFTPVAALLAIAGAVDLGVPAVLVAAVVAVTPVVASTRWPAEWLGSRRGQRIVAAGFVVVGFVFIASGLENL